MNDCQNPDGTYNGVKFFAQVTGLAEEEILWMWNRLRQLRNEGIARKEAMKIIAEETKGKPWLKS